jgi:hypothetical protein
MDIELKNKSLFDLLGGWKIDSQSLKDELSDQWLDFFRDTC